ncbi:hypothetical protein SAMN05518845_106266 [Variovorax sp. YR750]|uniref:hypothetical protein n=1 Tax=Variovorax sp. YR750 TaxID=1884384 RepID=UPI0008CF53EE|nr:hypothetical protein [Variovorax sp. YR750]SEL35015.1 hypothetical protein SAMN05518845_106266 [Variovorax sp. YR750]
MKSLPFAELPPETPLTAWHDALAGDSQTSSERYLTALARRAFLTLWSYPNVFTDEGRSRGKGDGKELCDLLVIFGSDILIFSDKQCEFIPHADVSVAWGRWYKRAIEKSANQLAGAKSWILRYADRLYLDKQCQHRLPIELPGIEDCRIHLIAVAKGATEHAARYWKTVAVELAEMEGLFDAVSGPSSGSLMIRTDIEGAEHRAAPFQVGWPLGRGHMVHVFDEETLDVVLGELDTVPDFVAYLRKKEEFFRREDALLIIPGEEDLLACYLSSSTYEFDGPKFPDIPVGAAFLLGEGEWKALRISKRYRNRVKANRVSYLWDALIEFQTSHILAGSSGVVRSSASLEGLASLVQQETILRKMAEEPRSTRRMLGAAVDRARSVKKKDARYTSTVLGRSNGTRAYVVMTLPKPHYMSYETYREHRQRQLLIYCEGCKLKNPHLKEVLGIAMEPYSTRTVSVDFLLMIVRDENLVADSAEILQRQLDEEGMWQPESIKWSRVSLSELPGGPSLWSKVWATLLKRMRS